MGVELYFIKVDPGEPVPDFPLWDDEGNDLPGFEQECVASLKWATYYDPKGWLSEADVGLGNNLLTPLELQEGAEKGLRALLEALMAIHPDFQKLAVPSFDFDDSTYSLVWDAFDSGADWLGGDAQARAASADLARELWGYRSLFERIGDAGKRGFHARWSY